MPPRTTHILRRGRQTPSSVDTSSPLSSWLPNSLKSWTCTCIRCSWFPGPMAVNSFRQGFPSHVILLGVYTDLYLTTIRNELIKTFVSLTETSRPYVINAVINCPKIAPRKLLSLFDLTFLVIFVKCACFTVQLLHRERTSYMYHPRYEIWKKITVLVITCYIVQH